MKTENKITLDTYFLILENQAKERVNNFIEMLYIKAKSEVKENIKVLNNELLEKYLTKRGYVRNMVLGTVIYTKDFTCVELDNNIIKVWHDKTNNKQTLITEFILTSLPITLNYFERI